MRVVIALGAASFCIALALAVAPVAQWGDGALAAPPRTFMGRRIAPTMSYHGAGWLVRAERNAEENTDLLLEQLRLSPGDVACDLGAGNGYHALRMAKKVAPTGKVVAVDIQPEMLRLLKARAAKSSIRNVETIVSEPDDPRLGKARCDLILIVDVYHELSDPAAILTKLKAALKPGGLIALVEFRAEDRSVPIKPLHKMSKPQMIKEFATADLRPHRTFDGLPWQHLVFFGVGRRSASTPPSSPAIRSTGPAPKPASPAFGPASKPASGPALKPASALPVTPSPAPAVPSSR